MTTYTISFYSHPGCVAPPKEVQAHKLALLGAFVVFVDDAERPVAMFPAGTVASVETDAVKGKQTTPERILAQSRAPDCNH